MLVCVQCHRKCSWYAWICIQLVIQRVHVDAMFGWSVFFFIWPHSCHQKKENNTVCACESDRCNSGLGVNMWEKPLQFIVTSVGYGVFPPTTHLHLPIPTRTTEKLLFHSTFSHVTNFDSIIKWLSVHCWRPNKNANVRIKKI